MSEFADNFLALVCPDEYDVLLVCARKIEAVMAMRDAYATATAKPPAGEIGRGGARGVARRKMWRRRSSTRRART